MEQQSESRVGFKQLLAVLWVIGLTLIYLVRYEACFLPWQLGHLLSATLPTLHIGPHFSEFIVARLKDGACVGATLAVAFALGAVATSRLLLPTDMLGTLVTLAIGLWGVAVAVLVIGITAIGKTPLVFAGLALWLFPAPREALRRTVRAVDRLDGWAQCLVACVVIAAALNLPGTLAPPFEYDELEYHLGALADYQRAGRIVYLPHNFYSNLPQLTEMLYLLAATTTSDVAAKLLHWTFGLLAALAVYAVGKRLWTRRVGVTAAALFYCVPFVQDLSQTARIDLATTFFATLAFGGLLVWSEDRNTERALWLSALMAGCAVATKWPAVAVVVLPALGFILVTSRSPRLIAGYCFLVALSVGPWLGKNWLLAGNPVYPLLHDIFPNSDWNTEQAALFAAKHYAIFNASTPLELVRLAWRYSFAEPGAAPLLLLGAPLMLLCTLDDPRARRAGGLFVAAYAGWFLFTFRPWRFLFPAFPLAALVGAWALHRLGIERKTGWLVSRCPLIVLAMSLCALALGGLVDTEDPQRVPPRMSFLQHALGQTTRDEFVARMGRGTFAPIVWMNQNLPADARVLYVGEARAYYARHQALWSTVFDQHPLEKATPPEFTHLYVNYSELERLRRSYGRFTEPRWTELANEYRQLYQAGPGVVFEK